MDFMKRLRPLDSATRFVNRTPIFKTMRPGTTAQPIFFAELYRPGQPPVEPSPERIARMAKYTERASREQDLFLEDEK